MGTAIVEYFKDSGSEIITINLEDIRGVMKRLYKMGIITVHL